LAKRTPTHRSVDNDQGESGASTAWREGFQRLVSAEVEKPVRLVEGDRCDRGCIDHHQRGNPCSSYPIKLAFDDPRLPSHSSGHVTSG
jgi:hypothetical protein